MNIEIAAIPPIDPKIIRANANGNKKAVASKHIKRAPLRINITEIITRIKALHRFDIFSP